MQLIKITNTPIQYQYEVERGHFETRNSQPLEAKIQTDKAELSIKSKNIEVRLNTDAMRESIGIYKTTTWSRMNGQRGWQKAREGVNDTVQTGNQMERIYTGVSISDIIRNKMIGSPPTFNSKIIPSEGPEITWSPNELQMDYKPAEVNVDWQMMEKSMNYIPGKFDLIITQYPKVSIEYTGGFNYVPPSADPEYKEP